MENSPKVEVSVEQLEKAGMKQMAAILKRMKAQKAKMMIAYENYRYVRPEKFTQFNERLRKETEQKNQFGGYSYDRLRFTPLDQYGKIPPVGVLAALEKANELSCFDRFVVADIESVVERPDPIVFGIVEDCSDYFFVGQWDDDVKIEDILGQNEG